MRSHLVLLGALLAGASACAQPLPAVSAPPAAVTTSPPPPSRAAAPAAPFYASLLEPAVSFPIQFHTSTQDCAGDTPCPPPTSTPGRCASLGAPRTTARGPLVVLRCTASDEGFDVTLFDLALVDTPEGLALVQGPAPTADAALATMAVVVPADLASFAPDEPSGRWAGGLEGDRYCAEDASFEGHERSLKLCFARDRGLVFYETTWVSAAGAVIERRAERP